MLQVGLRLSKVGHLLKVACSVDAANTTCPHCTLQRRQKLLRFQKRQGLFPNLKSVHPLRLRNKCSENRHDSPKLLRDALPSGRPGNRTKRQLFEKTRNRVQKSSGCGGGGGRGAARSSSGLRPPSNPAPVKLIK